MITDICHQSLLIKLEKTENLLDSIRCVKTRMTFVPPLIRREICKNKYKPLIQSAVKIIIRVFTSWFRAGTNLDQCEYQHNQKTV
jgi:hypothetical protein